MARGRPTTLRTAAAIAAAVIAATVIAWPLSAIGADLRLLCAGAMKAPVAALLLARPAQAAASGASASPSVDTTYLTAGEIRERVAAGSRDDVVVAPSDVVSELVDRGLVVPGSAKPLGATEVGVAVRAGAPVPDIATPAALRATLLAARSVVMVDPAKGTSGRLVRALFDTLDIADAMRARTIARDGGYVVEAVVDGEAEIGLHQISEILPVAGVVLVGPLPEPLRRPTRYDAAVLATGVRRAEAQALVDALATAGTSGAFVSYGFSVVR